MNFPSCRRGGGKGLTFQSAVQHPASVEGTHGVGLAGGRGSMSLPPRLTHRSEGWRESMQCSPHLPALPWSISHPLYIPEISITMKPTADPKSKTRIRHFRQSHLRSLIPGESPGTLPETHILEPRPPATGTTESEAGCVLDLGSRLTGDPP